MLKEVFEPELRYISNPNIKELVVLVLDSLDGDAIGQTYMVAQAAYAAGHHPPCTHVPGGVLTHVKRVVHIADDLQRALAFSSNEKDRVIAATILHDIFKGKKENFSQHAKLAAEYVCRVAAANPELMKKLTWFEVTQITGAIAFHMGPFSHADVKKSMEKYSMVELATYIADYIAAQPDIALPPDSFDPAPHLKAHKEGKASI